MSLFQGVVDMLVPPLTEERAFFVSDCIQRFNSAFSLLDGHYVSKTEAAQFSSAWRDTYTEIKKIRMRRSESVFPLVREFLSAYENLEEIIKEHNAQYIEKENIRCDQLLSNIDGKSLDHQQRQVVLCDESRSLVIAGAGSGKTLTISAKVKYLCGEKDVSPDDILLISFTRKAAEEMTERIHRLGINLEATTFHKLGLDIISSANNKRPDVLDNLDGFVRDYFEHKIADDPNTIRALIEFFAYYLEIPADIKIDKPNALGELYDAEKNADLESLRSKYARTQHLDNISNERSASRKSLRNEQMKSLQEVQIANFFFLNGIEYEYEKLYPHESTDPMRKSYRPDFYLPEYDLWLEHFGVDKTGNLPWLSPVEAKKYKDGMVWKRSFHKLNGTILLETYSWYASEGILFEKLESMLRAHNVKFNPPDFADIFNSVYATKSDKYFAAFMKLCCTFITLFKSNGYQISELRGMYTKSTFKHPFFNQRTKVFINIIQPLMEAYDKYLSEQSSVDFSDMINSAAQLVEHGYNIHSYKWVIVDEYQDISIARYRLISAILTQTGAKLLCVGDDWQSIYRFAGSDISLFTRFGRHFGPSEIMRLESTYRNSQQLIDVAGKFVSQNPDQFKKDLKSPKLIDYPITFMCHSGNPYPLLKKSIDKIILTDGPNSSIMILGRTNYDFEILSQSGLFSIHANHQIRYKASPETPISFLTIHRSKGLEADNVILLLQGGRNGFPNAIADDPLLELVLTEQEPYPFAEERRLFYVALTRTRNRTFIITDESNPSEFLTDFDDYRGNDQKSVFFLASSIHKSKNIVSCPKCKTGALSVRLQGKSGRRFVGCSNYPKCDYTVNDISVLENPIYCPVCGGFLTKRNAAHGIFLGCTNYPLCDYTEQFSATHTEQHKYGKD